MNKETIKRDSKGRFAKKEKPATKEQIEQIERYIKQLEKERDMYKRLSERLGGDYLNKCAELGEVKRNLSAYEKYWPQLREIAKTWKKRANSLTPCLSYVIIP
jgi:chromosome segregation ATPase